MVVLQLLIYPHYELISFATIVIISSKIHVLHSYASKASLTPHVRGSCSAYATGVL